MSSVECNGCSGRRRASEWEVHIYRQFGGVHRRSRRRHGGDGVGGKHRAHVDTASGRARTSSPRRADNRSAVGASTDLQGRCGTESGSGAESSTCTTAAASADDSRGATSSARRYVAGPYEYASSGPACRRRASSGIDAETCSPGVVDPPPETASAPLDLQPVNAPILPPTAELPFPALAPIAPAAQVPQFPQFTPAPPVAQTPAISPEAPFLRWLPAFLRPRQQVPAVSQTPPTQMPVQQWTPPAQQWDHRCSSGRRRFNREPRAAVTRRFSNGRRRFSDGRRRSSRLPCGRNHPGLRDFRGGSRIASSDGGSVWPMR